MTGVLRLLLATSVAFGASTIRLASSSAGLPSSPKPLLAESARLDTAFRAPPEDAVPAVMLGIDVLAANGFDVVKGKRLGLLTHPAGVNRRGISTIDVLRNAPGTKLVALYAVEHGIYNELPAEKQFPDKVDPRTGLMVFSLYNDKTRRFVPTAAQLKDIDALVIDLQDIGTRTYTFAGAMKSAMTACFANGKEVIVLDRPNPLGGLKVDGPLLDANWMSDVGRFRVPYVHGLTIGELALMVKAGVPPGGLALPDSVRTQGKLTVVPMRGWRRAMRWPETGLPWIPTSRLIQDFDAVQGYPMTGLGCMLGGFRHGFRQGEGSVNAFRVVQHLTVKVDIIEKELRALNLPGLGFRRVSMPDPKTGKPTTGLLIEINDYDAWQPTDLSFYLMKLACKLEPRNPFAAASPAERRTFLVHMGSAAFMEDLVARGKDVDIAAWIQTWRDHARIFQERSKKYWLYQ
jgi:uncharacterized protein YbbC (DUF1343 family)